MTEEKQIVPAQKKSEECTVCLTLKLCIKRPLALPPDFHLFMEVRKTLFHDIEFLRDKEWYNKLMIGPDSSFAQWTRNLKFEFGQITRNNYNMLGIAPLKTMKNEMPGLKLHFLHMHEWRFCGTTKHKKLHNIQDGLSKELVFRIIRDAAAKGHTSVQMCENLTLSPMNFILLPKEDSHEDGVYNLWKPYCSAQTWTLKASANGLIKIDTLEPTKKRNWFESKAIAQEDDDDDYGTGDIDTEDMLAKRKKCSVCSYCPPLII